MSIRDYNIEQIARSAISIVLLIIAGANCHAQEQVTLRRVEIVGLKRLNAQQVIDLSGLKVGDITKRDAIDAAAQKLMDSGLFKKLGYRMSIKGNEAFVTFDVEEIFRLSSRTLSGSASKKLRERSGKTCLSLTERHPKPAPLRIRSPRHCGAY